jgi:hypothetical protein
MRQERGLSVATIKLRCHSVRRLFGTTLQSRLSARERDCFARRLHPDRAGQRRQLYTGHGSDFRIKSSLVLSIC